MFNKKITWIIFILLSLSCLFITKKIFKKAFPIVIVSLDMSRDDALNKALIISKEYNLGPDTSFQVATFGVNQNAQNYIELDQGGASKFIEVVLDLIIFLNSSKFFLKSLILCIFFF